MGQWTDILERQLAGCDDASHKRLLRIPDISRWEEGCVWASVPVSGELLTPVVASVFGGYLAAVADHFLGCALFTVLKDDESFATAELHTHFLRPARGGTLDVEARVLSRGRRSAYCEALIRDGEGRLVVRAGATQMIQSEQAARAVSARPQ